MFFEQKLTEFQNMCDYPQKSADSHFTRKKVVFILTDEGRTTLTNTQLKISGLQGSQVENFGEDEFEKHLERYFGITIKRKPTNPGKILKEKSFENHK